MTLKPTESFLFQATLLGSNSQETIDSIKIHAPNHKDALDFARHEFTERKGLLENLDDGYGAYIHIDKIGSIVP